MTRFSSLLALVALLFVNATVSSTDFSSAVSSADPVTTVTTVLMSTVHLTSTTRFEMSGSKVTVQNSTSVRTEKPIDKTCTSTAPASTSPSTTVSGNMTIQTSTNASRNVTLVTSIVNATDSTAIAPIGPSTVVVTHTASHNTTHALPTANISSTYSAPPEATTNAAVGVQMGASVLFGAVFMAIFGA
ncbi:hypothetical protein EJ02DRAFT_515526 [Clathrospora elynae]|uniref:GPI anchored protein n=1 Tax=Clathrospora elynae TaxID=706981 RepID=A0A6A5SB77_9PLEO|nr:hypothetical protein EJ02DRAFT_515526 [Clathrospora elynae]